MLKRHLRSGSDFTSTREIKNKKVERFLPKGWSVDILRREKLLEVKTEGFDSYDREHVIPAFYRLDLNVDIVKDFEGLSL
ncbi:MAG: hypothetical protein MJK18_10430, partial [Bdellovibrionales bacterium]|nr:hypothetical protein [Bdellovibrionales bacterium]